MKDEHIRRTWVVTHYLPCEVCSEMKLEKDLAPKSSYVFGEGWLKMKQACQSCFDAEKRKLEANVKPGTTSYAWSVLT